MGEFMKKPEVDADLFSIDTPDYEAIAERLVEMLPVTSPDTDTLRKMGTGDSLVAIIRWWAEEINQTDPDRVTRELFGQAVLDEGKYT